MDDSEILKNEDPLRLHADIYEIENILMAADTSRHSSNKAFVQWKVKIKFALLLCVCRKVYYVCVKCFLVAEQLYKHTCMCVCLSVYLSVWLIKYLEGRQLENNNKLGLSWAKLSSNWNLNLVLLKSRFLAIDLLHRNLP